MAHLYQQCDLWASRSKMNEGKKAMMDCRAECILLVRFIECSQLMLITDKHPEGKLSKEDKEQCKANLDSALRRLEVAKPRLKQQIQQLFKEQLRRAAAANTTAVGDALEEEEHRQHQHFVEAMLKLAELGFTDTSRNAVLLEQLHNDVAAVLDRLIQDAPAVQRGAGGAKE